jgi:hypothetical protein
VPRSCAPTSPRLDLRLLMAILGYSRVSTVHQSPDMQIAALKATGTERIWTEQASGDSSTSMADRPRKLACNSFMEAGAMYADNPVLNQSPPPKNFSRSEAMQGCLDQLKKRIGY